MGKGDIRRLQTLPRRGDFPGFELYIGSFEDSLLSQVDSLAEHVRIHAIHNPVKVLVNGKYELFNLVGPGSIGEVSRRDFIKTIELAQKLKAIVVVHGARYDPLLKSRSQALEELASFISSCRREGVDFVFENDALWFNTSFPEEVLVVHSKDFEELSRLLGSRVKIAFDFEHFHLTYYFMKFFDRNDKKLNWYTQKEEGRELFERDYRLFITKFHKELEEDFYNSMRDFVRSFSQEIEHVHIKGSDCCSFFFDAKRVLPLEGEMLPIGFQDGDVCDRFNYLKIKEVLGFLDRSKDIGIVLELGIRPEKYDFYSQMKHSKRKLDQLLIHSNKKTISSNEGDLTKGNVVVQERVVVIGAHLDDEVLGVGGTILHHKEKGDYVGVCIVTSPYTPEWDEAYISRKEAQAKEVDEILRIDERHYLHFPTTKLNTIPFFDLYTKLKKTLLDFAPTTVYTHFPHDAQIDHCIIGKALISICCNLGYNLRFFETLSSTEWAEKPFNPNFYVNISDHVENKVLAFSKYTTEVRDHPHPRSLQSLRILAIKRGTECQREHAEAFMSFFEVID